MCECIGYLFADDANGIIKDLDKIQLRAIKLVPGNYCKTPQVQRETSEIKITNITVQTHSWRQD